MTVDTDFNLGSLAVREHFGGRRHRVKFVAYHANKDLPAWDTLIGATQQRRLFWSSSRKLRYPVRHFGNAEPFMLSGGTTYESRNFHTPQDVNVCFYLSSCERVQT